MKLCEIIKTKCIVNELTSETKEDAIREIVNHLVVAGKVKKGDVDSLVTALMAREQLGSTGIGQGLAVPHAKHENVGDLIGAFGSSKKGIEFDSLDGEPVSLIFLLLSNKEASGQHLEALAYITKLLRDDVFCSFLKDAKDVAEISELFKEADDKLAAAD